MDFWNNKVNVSKEAAELQVAIINKFSPEKRLKIAFDFANMGINQTRDWIKNNHPHFSELEITLEFVKIMYYQTGEMSEEHWSFYKKELEKKIKKDWSVRFRKMIKENHWTYDDVAKFGNFKSGKVIESTISRGLPSFAKIAVVIFERQKQLSLPSQK